MTQQGLATELGVTQQAVSSWLRGVSRPNYETRKKIEDLLGVPVDAWTDTGSPSDASDSGDHPAAGSAEPESGPALAATDDDAA